MYIVGIQKDNAILWNFDRETESNAKKMPKFYLNLGYKLKKKALCYSHLNNTVDILDRNIVMDYFRHENHWQSSQKKKNNNKTIYYILLYNKILYICIREY